MPGRTLVFYLTRIIGRGILVALAALSMLGLAIELREEAAAVMAHGGGPALLRFALFILPEIALSVTPIALLAGAILGFATLARRGEAVILRATGLSTLQIAAALLPLALCLGAGLHLLNDRLLPAAEAARMAEFGTLDDSAREAGTLWLRTPGWVLRATPDAADGTRLADVTVFSLDAAGALTHRIDAASAQHDGDAWLLEDAVRTGTATGATTEESDVTWTSELEPADVLALAGAEDAITRSEARAALAGERLTTRPSSFYETRAARALSLAAMPAVLILVASPVVLGAGRSGGALLRATALATALGVAFVLGEGVAVSLGEKGLLDPLAAVWTPALVAVLLGLWTILRAEG